MVPAPDSSVAAPPRSLPPVGTYLRGLWSLGMRSIPAALPALVFLCFYRFGMDLYLEFAAGDASPLGLPDERARLVHAFMTISAYLPLLVLVYTPFLPLQDGLLRGERLTFFGAIRAVLERFVPFVVSVIAQLLILLFPIALVLGALVALVAPFPEIPREIAAVVTVALLLPTILWVLIAGLFLIFAMPALILDGYGPIGSIRASMRLVAGRFWGILGRLFIWFLLLVALAALCSIPAVLLRAGAAAVSGTAGSAFRIVGVFWMSLITAISFPFWVSSLMVLYRALVPGRAEEIVPEAASSTVPLPEVLQPEATKQPTPYIFE